MLLSLSCYFCCFGLRLLLLLLVLLFNCDVVKLLLGATDVVDAAADVVDAAAMAFVLHHLHALLSRVALYLHAFLSRCVACVQ